MTWLQLYKCGPLHVNARIFGVVMNDVSLDRRGHGYQRYRYYYGEKPALFVLARAG